MGGKCGIRDVFVLFERDEDPHFPPIDYRYGWNLSKAAHQLQLLWSLLRFGTDCLFAAPNCAPWGNDSRATPEAQRAVRRACETSTLTFLTVACIFQVLLDRKYIIENSAHSDIFDKSPLKGLRDLPYHLALFDQCSCGPTESGDHFKKRSHFQSSHALHHLQKLCPGGHTHTRIREVADEQLRQHCIQTLSVHSLFKMRAYHRKGPTKGGGLPLIPVVSKTLTSKKSSNICHGKSRLRLCTRLLGSRISHKCGIDMFSRGSTTIARVIGL